MVLDLFRKTEQQSMEEKFNNQYPPQKRNDETARVVAGMYGVSERYVRMVMDGERDNDEILAACIEYKNGKNLLVEAVRSMIPFTAKNTTSINFKTTVHEAN